jgi:excisionase family DNA binding protein
MSKAYLTTAQAAARLGVSPSRVRQLIAAGRIKANKIGRDNMIRASSLKAVADRKPGWPKGRKRQTG